MLELLEKLDYVNLMIASIIVSVVASAFHVYLPEFFKNNFRKKINVIIIALVVTFLNLVGFVKLHEITVADYILKFIFTLSFSLLFYQFMGVWAVNKIFETIKNKLK